MWYFVEKDGSYEPTNADFLGIGKRKGRHVKGMCFLTKRFKYSEYEPKDVIFGIRDELYKRTHGSSSHLVFMPVSAIDEFVVVARTKNDSVLCNICTEIGFDEIAQ